MISIATDSKGTTSVNFNTKVNAMSKNDKIEKVVKISHEPVAETVASKEPKPMMLQDSKGRSFEIHVPSTINGETRAVTIAREGNKVVPMDYVGEHRALINIDGNKVWTSVAIVKHDGVYVPTWKYEDGNEHGVPEGLYLASWSGAGTKPGVVPPFKKRKEQRAAREATDTPSLESMLDPSARDIVREARSMFRTLSTEEIINSAIVSHWTREIEVERKKLEALEAIPESFLEKLAKADPAKRAEMMNLLNSM